MQAQQPGAPRLVRTAAVSLVVGGLLAGCAVLLAAGFAVLAPGLAGHRGSPEGLSFSPLVPAGAMLMIPLLMVWTGRAMGRFRRWTRMGGIVVAVVMIALLLVARQLVLDPGSPLHEHVGASSHPDDFFSAEYGGLLVTALLFPLLVFAANPVFVSTLVACIAAWPLSIIILLGSKWGKATFEGQPPAAEAAVSPSPEAT